MGEGENGHLDMDPQLAAAAAATRPVAILQVVLMPDGRVTLNYPQDEVIARYLLSKAEAIMNVELAKRAEGNLIQPVNLSRRL